jgi:hypothetical protein
MTNQYKALKIILILAIVGCLFYPRHQKRASALDWGMEEPISIHKKNFTEGFYVNITTNEKNTAQIEYAFNGEPNFINCNNLNDYDAIWYSASFVAMKDYYLLLFKTAHLGDTCVYMPRNRNINPMIFTNVYAIDTDFGKLASYHPDNNKFLIFDLNSGKTADEAYLINQNNRSLIEFAGFKNGHFRATLGS